MSYINNINNNFINNVGKKSKPQRDDINVKAEDKAVKNDVRPQERPQVSASDVLSFMANSAVYTKVATTKQINPAKYVTTEQRADIAKSMESFEKTFEDKFNSIVKEMPGISEKAAMALAAKMVEEEV